MQTQSKETTIAQRIKKLLALADGNQNEHERAAAMKLAMELLAKHNLDMAAVKELSYDQDVSEYRAFLKLDPWTRYVINAACALYYTEMIMRAEYRGYYHDRKEYHPTIVGTEENIAVTIEVAGWLINSIRCESNWLFTEPHERRSFRLGAAHRVYKRACEIVKEESIPTSNPTGSSALTVLRNELEQANKRYLAGKKLGTFKGRSSYSDSDAYEKGSMYGDSVNLGKKTTRRAITLRE
ncbi:MAG: DUF2786 domain-containing protein [Candidatus Obscuribacterales bacterium]|nr:DUF2786 domain-containing protein [Candidatus Obscuribacterales bacterium]